MQTEMDPNPDIPVTQRSLVDLKEAECPWKPETVDKPEELFGREEDIRILAGLIQQFEVVILDGASASGKSSLLSAGLSRRLSSDEYEVIRCRNWPASQTDNSQLSSPSNVLLHSNAFESILIPQIVDALELDDETENDWKQSHDGFTATMIKVIDEGLGKKPLIILDQFEEFLSVASGDAEQQSFLEWITNVVDTFRGKLRLVISLRSEQYYLLTLILKELTKRGIVERYCLLPLENPADLRRIILTPVELRRGEYDSDMANCIPSRNPLVHIDDSVVDLIQTDWKASQLGDRMSVLEVKSLLYALFWTARTPTSSSVDIGLSFVNQWRSDHGGCLASRESKRDAFSHLVMHKLHHCEEVASQFSNLSVPSPIVLDEITRIVPLLSAGGYKIRRSVTELFSIANEDEIAFGTANNEAATRQFYKAFADTTIAWNRADVDLGGRLSGLFTHEWEDSGGSSIVGIDCVPWMDDAHERSSGPWLGRNPDEALTWLGSAFLTACDWLDAVHLCSIGHVRNSSHQATVTLYHDQLAAALDEWRHDYLSDHNRRLESMIMSPLATSGQQVNFSKSTSTHDRLIINVRWTSNDIVGAVLTNVVFANCDFRGTRFRDCYFDGVSFINCSLDRALFDGCHIRGQPSHEPILDEINAVTKRQFFDEVWASRETRLANPKFIIPFSEDLCVNLSILRSLSIKSGAHWLYSPTSGMPCLPIDDSEVDRVRTLFSRGNTEIASVEVTEQSLTQEQLFKGCLGVAQPADHGLEILGGRVSSLMFSGCDFRDEKVQRGAAIDKGKLILAYVAGSSVDFVEQNELNLSIQGAAVRGLSITRPVEGQVDSSSEFSITVTESAIVNTWIGTDIGGTLQGNWSTIQSLACLSNTLRIDVPSESCPNQAWVNPPMIIDGTNESESTQGSRMVDDILNISYKTTYRSTPARAEYGFLRHPKGE